MTGGAVPARIDHVIDPAERPGHLVKPVDLPDLEKLLGELRGGGAAWDGAAGSDRPECENDGRDDNLVDPVLGGVRARRQ